jgi:hypothetical protein
MGFYLPSSPLGEKTSVKRCSGFFLCLLCVALVFSTIRRPKVKSPPHPPRGGMSLALTVIELYASTPQPHQLANFPEHKVYNSTTENKNKNSV